MTADFFMDTSLFIFPDFGLKSFDILSNLTAEKQHTDQIRDSHHRTLGSDPMNKEKINISKEIINKTKRAEA